MDGSDYCWSLSFQGKTSAFSSPTGDEQESQVSVLIPGVIFLMKNNIGKILQFWPDLPMY